MTDLTRRFCRWGGVQLDDDDAAGVQQECGAEGSREGIVVRCSGMMEREREGEARARVKGMRARVTVTARVRVREAVAGKRGESA